jgi:hypothetical protein
VSWNIFTDSNDGQTSWHRSLPNGWTAVVWCVGTSEQSCYFVGSECEHCRNTESVSYPDINEAKAAALVSALKQDPCTAYDCKLMRDLTSDAELSRDDRSLLAGR